MAKDKDRDRDEETLWSHDDVSDLLVLMAVIAHKHGINAIAPNMEILLQIQAFAQQHGQTITAEDIARMLRLAQIELLKRQLDGE